MTPLLLAADTFPKGYTNEMRDHMTCRKKIIKQLLARSGDFKNLVLNCCPEFWIFPKKRIKNGVPKWTPLDEYVDVSRSILHAIMCIPDVVWVEEIFSTLTGSSALGDTLKLKKKSGRDVACLAVDTFLPICTTGLAEPTLGLFKILNEVGANMNSVTHPIFTFLDEA
eukprot:12427506-Ditylum_brightwellii.AAC.1